LDSKEVLTPSDVLVGGISVLKKYSDVSNSGNSSLMTSVIDDGRTDVDSSDSNFQDPYSSGVDESQFSSFISESSHESLLKSSNSEREVLYCFLFV
jgi:hypothetical protein